MPILERTHPERREMMIRVHVIRCKMGLRQCEPERGRNRWRIVCSKKSNNIERPRDQRRWKNTNNSSSSGSISSGGGTIMNFTWNGWISDGIMFKRFYWHESATSSSSPSCSFSCVRVRCRLFVYGHSVAVFMCSRFTFPSFGYRFHILNQPPFPLPIPYLISCSDQECMCE